MNLRGGPRDANRWIAMVGFLALSACEDAAPVPDYNALRVPAPAPDTVRNPAPAWGANEGWKVADSPYVVLGGVDIAPGAEILRAKSAFLVGDSLIAVADLGTASVRLFSLDGTVVTVLGGPGGGPGEFRSLVHARLLDDTSIAAWDSDGSMAVFGMSGEILDTRTEHRGRIGNIREGMVPTPSNTIFLRGVPYRSLSKPGSEFRRAERFVGLLREGHEGIDTLTWIGGIEQFRFRDEYYTLPFAANLLMAGGGEPFRLVTVDGKEAAFTVWDERGAPLRRVEWEASRPVVADSVWAMAVDEVIATSRERDESPETLERAYGSLPGGTRVAVASRVHVDETGHIWIQRQPLPIDSAAVWNVFSPSGRWLGQVELAKDLRPLHIGSDRILAVRWDDVGVEWILGLTMDRTSVRPST